MNALSHSCLHRRRRAVALIVVLAVLALLSTLLVAFMGKVGTENVAARTVARTVEAKQAYDSAVNLVISQIRDATRTDGTLAWASQPGVIRTFNAAATNQDVMVYKLYSSDRMQLSAASYQPTSPVESGIVLGNLTTTPDGFVDLNQPALVPIPNDSQGRMEARYPIVNPTARQTITGTDPVPNATDRRLRGIVDGFYSPKILHPSKKLDANGNAILSLPMRVKWLYQLKDGTLVAPDSGNRFAGASKTNPPVARVAFWTDDESAKVNVNTASENTFWDTPSVSTQQESGMVDAGGALIYSNDRISLGAAQPAAREYQRFPGHPATTCLSPVLRWLAPDLTDVDFKEAIYRLAPRLVGGRGSSMGGSMTTDTFYNSDTRVFDRDRLFATLDEYWFRPDRTPMPNNGLYGVFTNRSGNTILDTPFTTLTPEALDRVRFFLTANSRAPELNLWGMPRVCIWPVAEKDALVATDSKRTGFDDLITFCSTVATKPYIFSRRNPWSTTEDYEQSGADTRAVDPLTGTDKVYANSGRNKQLMENYLRRLTRKPVPGVGVSFDKKYSALDPNKSGFTDMDQILLSIFDYIRCTNLVDTGRSVTTGNYPLAYTPGYGDYTGSVKSFLGSGQVIPTVRYANGKPAIKGFGRFVTLGELGLLFYVDPTVLPGEPPAAPNESTTVLPVRCVLLPEMFTVSPGYPALSEGYGVRVTEIDPFKINGQALQIAPMPPGQPVAEANSGLVNFVEVDSYRVPYGRFFMPTRGFTNQFFHDNGVANGTSGGKKPKIFSRLGANPKDRYAQYPFYSKRMLLPFNGASAPTTFSLTGGTFKIEILSLVVSDSKNPAPDPLEGQVIQEINVSFPSTTLPAPKTGGTTFQARINNYTTLTTSNSFSMIEAQDVVRTMEPAGSARGDYRLIAGKGVVPASDFATSGTTTDYNSSTIMQVHNFRNGHGDIWPGAKSTATLTAGGTPRTDKKPKVALAAQGSLAASDPTVTGDFDRFISKHTDGPFINKPDEGNVRLNLADDFAGGDCIPYYRGGNGYEEVGFSYFSPNRMIPSAIMFGSLPSGIMRGRAFETLLFAPPVTNAHYGNAFNLPDHYLLDMFHMPVVEPYAISEPLSCSGRVNLNCRLAPFGYVKVDGRSYIERTTGIYAVLGGMKQLAVPTKAPFSAHTEHPYTDLGIYRFDIDAAAVVNKIINPRLDDPNKSYFRSPTQICEIDLLTNEFTDASSRRTYWENHNVTGDNQRERAYAQIYPRLTTKSNVYTVHAWAQSIQKNPATKDDGFTTFDENVDRVTGEYRGSTMIERFIDPNDPALATYDAADTNATDLERFYRFRILSSKRFVAE